MSAALKPDNANKTAQELFEEDLRADEIRGARLMIRTLDDLPNNQRTLYTTLVDFAFTEGQNDQGPGDEQCLMKRFRNAIADGAYVDGIKLGLDLDVATLDQSHLYINAMEYAYEEGRIYTPD